LTRFLNTFEAHVIQTFKSLSNIWIINNKINKMAKKAKRKSLNNTEQKESNERSITLDSVRYSDEPPLKKVSLLAVIQLVLNFNNFFFF
jgi:uncharacterized protein YnzC (UPF0291/DUF896 family)